jgi:outer membrane murein-binding lipoprotein Lpp
LREEPLKIGNVLGIGNTAVTAMVDPTKPSPPILNELGKWVSGTARAITLAIVTAAGGIVWSQNGTITRIDTTMSQHSAWFIDLKVDKDARQKQEVEDARAKADLDNSVKNLVNGQADLGRKADFLKSNLDTLKSDVGGLKSDVGALKTDLGAVKTDTGAVKGQVEALGNRLVGDEASHWKGGYTGSTSHP